MGSILRTARTDDRRLYRLCSRDIFCDADCCLHLDGVVMISHGVRLLRYLHRLPLINNRVQSSKRCWPSPHSTRTVHTFEVVRSQRFLCKYSVGWILQANYPFKKLSLPCCLRSLRCCAATAVLYGTAPCCIVILISLGQLIADVSNKIFPQLFLLCRTSYD